MKLEINGEPRTVTATSLAALIDELQLPADHLVVELNLAVVPREQFAATRLQENDRLELIQFVGGG